MENENQENENSYNLDDLTPEELKELESKAHVSSQNFERAKKAEDKVKELQEQIATLQAKPKESSTKENGKEEEIAALRAEIADIRANNQKQEVFAKYPQLKDVWNEFEEFQGEPENAGMPILTAAKAFVVEKELTTPRREGFERDGGGSHEAASTEELTWKEAENLRKTNYRAYREAIKNGRVKT